MMIIICILNYIIIVKKENIFSKKQKETSTYIFHFNYYNHYINKNNYKNFLMDSEIQYRIKFVLIHNISQIFKDISYRIEKNKIINKLLTRYIERFPPWNTKYNNARIRLYHKSFLKGNTYQLKVKTCHRNKINSQIGRGLVSH